MMKTRYIRERSTNCRVLDNVGDNVFFLHINITGYHDADRHNVFYYIHFLGLGSSKKYCQPKRNKWKKKKFRKTFRDLIDGDNDEVERKFKWCVSGCVPTIIRLLKRTAKTYPNILQIYFRRTVSVTIGLLIG